MWLIYTFLHTFFLALVNYSDEYLTHSNSTCNNASIHERIGGVLLISTFLCVIGISCIYLFVNDVSLNEYSLMLSIGSAIPMIISWGGYFYCLQIFSVHQVMPLFSLSSVVLLLIELIFGAYISVISLLGIMSLIFGSYLINRGSFDFKSSVKLLVYMSPAIVSWAASMFMVKLATAEGSAMAVYFWQLVGMLFLAFVMFVTIKPYRKGLIGRIKNDEANFIIHSLFNESLSQLSFLFATLAISLAPLATYVSSLSGTQGVFLFLILKIFPLHDRNEISKAQWVGIICISMGIFMLEFLG